jgi:hypothetical protein
VFNKSIIPNGFLQSTRAGLLTTINNNELIIINKPAEVPSQLVPTKSLSRKAESTKLTLEGIVKDVNKYNKYLIPSMSLMLDNCCELYLRSNNTFCF